MIEIQDVSKQFDCVTALRHLTLKVQDGSVFGLVGSNGAGKSTLLRILAGVYRPDSGRVLINGQAPFENEQVKRSTVFISDYPYLAPTATVRRLARLYRSVYPGWSEDYFARMEKLFPISFDARLGKMSKGMQRQAAILLGLSTQPRCILFDEIFDGLDPVVRELVKKLLAALLVGAVSFFAGMFFYRRRSGECAEQTLSTPVVYVLATTGAALSLVCLPMLLTLQANQYGVYALLCGAGVGVMTLVCTLVYTRKVVNPTAAVLCSTLVVVTVGTVCLLGVQGSDYRNKVPAAEDVAQVTVQPMVQDPLVDLPDYMLEPGTHSVSTDTTEPQELESSYTFTDPASVAAIVQLHRDCITAAETEVLGGSGFKSSFRYKLKNGKVLTRIYTAYGDNGANVIRSTKEYKQQQPFVKNSAKENLLLVSLISTERDDLYWNQTMEDNRGEVQVDQSAYYAAIRADFMELTQADWTYMNMQDASWSTVSFAIYQVRPGTDSKTRRQLQKMDPEALRTYYNRFYSTHTDSDPPCPVVRSVVYLPNQSGGANRTLKLLQKDGFIYGAQTTLPSADQVETMLVSPICTVSADYTEGDGCLLGEPDSEDGYYLTRPESLLGGQVVRKNFASLYTDPFRTVTDRKAIARTLAGVQPGADQMERLKKAKQGYAVSLITNDGKATKMYFVPTAYGYEQGKPTTDAASDLDYALE